MRYDADIHLYNTAHSVIE